MADIIAEVPVKSSDKLQFTKATTPEQRGELLDKLPNLNPVLIEEEKKYYQEIEPTPQDIEEISGLLEVAKKKLQELDFAKALPLLPTVEQVHLTRITPDPEATDNSSVGGSAGLDHVRIDLPEGVEVTDQAFKGAFFHELYHGVTQNVIAPAIDYKGDLVDRRVASGFNRIPLGPITNRGIWEEGLADMFGAFCSESENPTPYAQQTPFMMTLVADIAQKTGQTPFDCFKEMAVAAAQRDFSFQKKLVQIYGNEFVKSINSAETFMGAVVRTDLDKIANLGGFGTQFKKNIDAIESGQSITFPGLKGSIKADINPPEFRRI